MPLEPVETGSPNEWLRHALADLSLAISPLPENGLYETLCFHAQQAAEKSLKAVLVYLTTDFPHTHNIQRLVDLLPSNVEKPPALFVAARLTAYAVSTRYPGQPEPVDEEEYREAVETAEAVFDWAKALIHNG